MIGNDNTIRCTLREHRQRRRLSQDELARLVGVRRQAVYDIESGRYLPNTAVALRLARVLGCTVEMLFVADAPVKTRSLHPQYGAGAANAVLILGCDPALSVLGGLMTSAAPGIRAHTVFASSRRALRAIHEGAAHVAGTHYHSFGALEGNIEAVRSLSPDMSCLIVAFALQEEGLMVAAGNPLGIRTVEDLANGRTRFVNREEGAALRTLLDAHLSRHGVPASAVRGYATEAHSHSEGAMRVASGTADAALGLRLVAEAFALHFVPLATTRCDLVIPSDVREHPGITVLLDVLQSPGIRKELGALPGYDAADTGRVILG